MRDSHIHNLRGHHRRVAHTLNHALNQPGIHLGKPVEPLHLLPAGRHLAHNPMDLSRTHIHVAQSVEGPDSERARDGGAGSALSESDRVLLARY